MYIPEYCARGVCQPGKPRTQIEPLALAARFPQPKTGGGGIKPAITVYTCETRQERAGKPRSPPPTHQRHVVDGNDDVQIGHKQCLCAGRFRCDLQHSMSETDFRAGVLQALRVAHGGRRTRKASVTPKGPHWPPAPAPMGCLQVTHPRSLPLNSILLEMACPTQNTVLFCSSDSYASLHTDEI